MNNDGRSADTTVATPDQQAIVAWLKILEGVKELESVYDEHPELNDTQPAIAEACIPMSLDEWKVEIEELIEQLKARE